MKKPFKYFILCNKTKEIKEETNTPPSTEDLQTWEETADPNIKELRQTKTAFIDKRYPAKLRLYLYLNYTKYGVASPQKYLTANP